MKTDCEYGIIAKVTAGEPDICGCWRLSDELSYQAGKYVLTVHIAKKKGEEVQLQISFDDAEVLRNP